MNAKTTHTKLMSALGVDPEEHGSEPADKWDALCWIVTVVLLLVVLL